jgi:GTP cyclohydrolase I
MKILTHLEVGLACDQLKHCILEQFPQGGPIRLYGVPRGGVPILYMLLNLHESFCVATTPEEADVIVDDLIDSGATAERYRKINPRALFAAAFEKTADVGWLVFPWEQSEEKSIEDSFVRLLQFVGEDPKRGGLLETPNRMAKAWKAWTSGYDKDPAQILKSFEDGAEKCDEMVIVRDIPFYSQCEHHLAPFFGTASIGYIPNGKIVGLSKLSRLTDLFARRLQVQERLTNQIADAIAEHLGARGVGVVLRARHLCMESRGVCQQGHHTVTSALRGVMRDQPETRAEFVTLIKP